MITKTEIIYSGRIAGVSFGHFKFRPDRLRGLNLVVVPQPLNEYDPNAIALVFVSCGIARHVGYVPRQETRRLHEVLKAGGRLEARVSQIDLAAPPSQQAYVEITGTVRVPRPLNPPGTRRLILD